MRGKALAQLITGVAALAATVVALYLLLNSQLPQPQQPQPQSQGTEVTCEGYAYRISHDENKGISAQCIGTDSSEDVVICEMTAVEVTNPTEYTGSVDPDYCSNPATAY